MAPPPLFRFGTRVVLAFTLALVAVWLFGRYYVQLWQPLYHQIIAWLLPDFRVIETVLQSQPSGEVIQVSVELTRPAWIGANLLPPGLSVSSSTLQGYALQHPVILATVLFAWPPGEPASWTKRLGLLGFGLIGLTVVEMLDIPFVLAGAVTDLLLSDFAPGNLAASKLVRWMHFLNTGGRLALSLAVALIAVAFYRHLFARR